MRKNILIYGAGAIGRGFVPWLFKNHDVIFNYVDINKNLVNRLKKNKSFSSFRTKNNKYEQLKITVNDVFHFESDDPILDNYDFIISCVGPRTFETISDNFLKTNSPIICFENDFDLYKRISNKSENNKIYFGIPDVIASRIAPKKLLKKDPLAIVTEDGDCYIDNAAHHLGGNIKYISKSELEIQWLAKLYIHNTPHCIAAYLGSLNNKLFLHEGMDINEVYDVVFGSMMEMKKMLEQQYNLNNSFLDWYSKKELSRFSNKLLYDPISRVAREPFRKLHPNNRLIGAAQLALANGIVPINTVKGIISAFFYKSDSDPDFNIKYLVQSLSREDFLRLVIRLNKNEALFKIIMKYWEKYEKDFGK